MKILLDLQGAQSESRLRGIGRHIRALAASIIKNKGEHEVSILLNSMLTENFDEIQSEFRSLLPSDRIFTFHASGPVAEESGANDWRMRSAELLRETFIATLNPDVLHVGSLFEGFLDDAVSSIGILDADYLVATTLHDLIPLVTPEKYLFEERPRRHYLRRAQMLKRSDLLLATSDSSKREAVDFLDFDPSKIQVTGCGVEPQFQMLKMTEEQRHLLRYRFKLVRPYVLHVGAVDPRKNVEILISAFASLPAPVRSRHCLAFAGSIPASERGRVKVFGARHGLKPDELVFCGHVTERDLVELYNDCAAFVFPSKHEGFGLPVLEAMACGAAVLASSATSLPEVVGRPEQLFDPDSPDDLATKLSEVLTDQDRFADHRAWGLAQAAKFTWDITARRTVEVFQSAHGKRQTGPVLVANWDRRPTMAYISPLPNDRTGIADYSASLLRELGVYYKIECIILDTVVSDEWVIANFPLRDRGWFERNAHRYDRIVYSVGNSHFHAGQLDLLERFPGVVILHDFFLSDLLEWMSHTSGYPTDLFVRELYFTHGLSGLLQYRDKGIRSVTETLACNDVVFRNSIGTIGHSTTLRDMAATTFGPSVASQIVALPFLRDTPPLMDRSLVRARLGLGTTEYVVCTFGLVTARKESRKIFEAWIASTLAHNTSATLVFVGAASDGYAASLLAAIKTVAGKSRIRVTGHVTAAEYSFYLAAADAAVQLRSGTRGETSAAIFDCLAAAVPVIVNEHGTSREFPDDTVFKLPDDFSTEMLTEKLDWLYAHRELALDMGRAGRRYVSKRHGPRLVGGMFYDAIENFWKSPRARLRSLISAIGDLSSAVAPTDLDLHRAAVSIGRNTSRVGLPRVFCDVTVLAEQDAKTGIQRVVRSILSELLAAPPAGFRVEAIRFENGVYRYARGFAEMSYRIPAAVLPDSEVDISSDDIFLGLDWVPDRIPQAESWLQTFRRTGGMVVFVVYDLLPLLLPQYFPDFMGDVTQRWFASTLRVADQFVCISQTVAYDVDQFAAVLGDPPRTDIAINHFHIGSDFGASLPSTGLASNAASLFAKMDSATTFLMVGTVEPRKGHRQVLAAFDLLWEQGANVSLVIVGKQGWMVDDFALKVDSHFQKDIRLFWLQGISDEMLDGVYEHAAALIAASAGEGFGLPIIEAAQHRLPVIARDIPVFREVAGEHALYFGGEDSAHLADVILRWVQLEAQGLAPHSYDLPHITWKVSTQQLVAAILGRLATIRPERAAAYKNV